jgi:2-oxoglutarate ferredoxin oxidoreductase subunit gamma
MTEEIIIAGFGGQGVLSMGKIMAYSGVMQGYGSKLDAIVRT